MAGVDEVGRGPLAGPVIAAAVVLPPDCRPLEGVRDSKLMTPQQREIAAELVMSSALFVSVAGASVREIDHRNIRAATILAIRRALQRLPERPEQVLVDGVELPELGWPHQAIVRGDSICQSIAAASIIAKVHRDRLMQKLAQRYPDFGWDSNKGYATLRHIEAIGVCGPTPHHRRSFAPVVQLKLF